jgi:hypothetical protein
MGITLKKFPHVPELKYEIDGKIYGQANRVGSLPIHPSMPSSSNEQTTATKVSIVFFIAKHLLYFSVSGGDFRRSDIAPIRVPPEGPSLSLQKYALVSFWLFKKEIYQANDFDLTPEDIVALVNIEENKRRLQLGKAHAVQAMAEQLTRGTKREVITSDIKMFVWQRDAGSCVECSSNENLEFDHVIPLAMGGSNSARNLQLLCETCNRRKGASLG